ncbi:MAG: SHOCT domain-containing protein [Turicibacter sp.]|nr:SHOCT domain-containing protein [Turicibacter sp.]
MSKTLKIISGCLEFLLGIPVLGFTIIWGTRLVLPGAVLILHIITLVFSIKEDTKKHGSILGIVSGVVGLIPFVGWIIRLVTGILLLVDGFGAKTESDPNAEIIKLKNMLEAGVITEEEFEQKKKQLLGLL